MKPIFIFICVLGLAGPALAKNTATDLQRIENELNKDRAQRDTLKQQAASYGRELLSLKSKMVKAARAIQSYEADALVLEARLRELKRDEVEKDSLLKARRGQFKHVLMALQRMASHPPEAMIASPQSPSDMIRGAILLRTAAPAIENRAILLRADLDAVLEARRQTQTRSRELAMAVTGLADKRQHLESLMVDKTRLKKQADAESLKAERRIQKLVGKAKNLRDLMTRLEADRRKRAAETEKKKPSTAAKASDGNNPPIGSSRGKLPFPAIGRLVGRYGQATENGLTRKGITIETRPGAQVIAPYGGQVMFAGAFKGYGQLLIIEHGEGYHSLLAGLSRIDSVIGQQILSGEPAGIMGGGASEPPILYVELRRNGQPINPLPWLAARKSKVNG